MEAAAGKMITDARVVDEKASCMISNALQRGSGLTKDAADD